MPAVGFTKPGSKEGGALSFADAPDWYDENTEVPSEAIRLVTVLEGDPRRRGTNLSPSNSSKHTVCVRQLCFKKFFDYLIDGCAEWMATEGTVFHDAFAEITPKALDGWYREVLIPDFFIKTAEGKALMSDDLKVDYTACTVTRKSDGYLVAKLVQYTKEHASWEVQVFDGIWQNGRVDKLSLDCTRIEDFKTKAWGGWKDRKTGAHKIRHYPPRASEDGVQLNLYRRMVELFTGVPMEKLTIRRVYKGARIAKEAWKKYDMDLVPDGELDLMIRDHVEAAVGQFEALKAIEDAHKEAGTDPREDMLEYMKDVPLTGHDKQMFNGTKCSLYCTQMPICFKAADMVRFDSSPSECQLIKPEEIT